MKILKKLGISSFIIIIFVLLNSCQDPVPTDYIPQTMVQAVLFVGQPITNIIVMETQPVINDSFNYSKSLIRDAQVKIYEQDNIMQLQISPSGSDGYYFADSTYLVKPGTTYRLEITLKDGTILTGETTTPKQINWTEKSPKNLQYPIDTLHPTAKDTIKWSAVDSTDFYLISLRCMDTLNYGIHLTPQTDEKNRRIMRPWNNDEEYQEINYWGLIPNTQSPIVWLAFKWFGLHEVSLYAPDINYLRWFIQYYVKRQYDNNLSSIKGNGFGVFGSTSVVRDTVFLLKNQP